MVVIFFLKQKPTKETLSGLMGSGMCKETVVILNIGRLELGLNQSQKTGRLGSVNQAQIK